MTYTCAIWNHDCTFPGGTARPSCLTLVATTRVKANSSRAAAAKGYVRCVGRRRARLLQEVLHAPAALIRQETDWRAIATSLMRSPDRLGDCYCFDNLVEAWYITVQPARHAPSRRSLSSRLWHSLRHPSPN